VEGQDSEQSRPELHILCAQTRQEFPMLTSTGQVTIAKRLVPEVLQQKTHEVKKLEEKEVPNGPKPEKKKPDFMKPQPRKTKADMKKGDRVMFV